MKDGFEHDDLGCYKPVLSANYWHTNCQRKEVLYRSYNEIHHLLDENTDKLEFGSFGYIRYPMGTAKSWIGENFPSHEFRTGKLSVKMSK